MALFTLRHASGSAEEKAFLESLDFLATLRGVSDFKVWKQTSTAVDYDYGISMRFQSASEFRQYMTDPDHLWFAYETWFPQIKVAMEINLDDEDMANRA